MDSLTALLASRTMAELVVLLFGVRTEPQHVRELAQEAGTAFSAIRRELLRLEKAGVLRSSHQGNRMLFQPDPAHPFFPALQMLALQSTPLWTALWLLLPWRDLDFAILHGPTALETENSPKPLGLLLIGVHQDADVLRAIQRVKVHYPTPPPRTELHAGAIRRAPR
ncbi:MAG: winged helix-turn-helix domain-containing protein [Chthoniobacteraceae bacterium]